MNRQQAIQKYGRVADAYRDADEYCVVMENDKRLRPVSIPLPEPPDWALIDGWGLPPREQVFTRQKYPVRLKKLEDSCSTIEEMWSALEEQQHRYKVEIAWIEKQIYHELYGYWFFCNGKPTYVTGDHYVYCNFWYGDKGLMDYRDRDRKFYLFDQYIQSLPNFYGFNYPKFRREGATSKAAQKNYFTICKLQRAFGGIQSKTDDHSEEVYLNHIVQAWRRLPFFFKPRFDSSDKPKGGMSFDTGGLVASKDRGTGRKGSVLTTELGLGSGIDYRSSEEFAYDGFKLHFYHGDEVGKTKKVDVKKRYYVIKEVLKEGTEIHGHCINTSTVEDMERDGGARFYELCNESMFHDALESDTGETLSGLATLFIPSYEGLEGFIDRFGASITEAPTEEQKDYLRDRYPNRVNLDIGAREYIQNKYNEYIKKKDFEGLMKFRRKYPLEYADCWSAGSADTGLPVHIVEERLAELALMGGSNVKIGNFVRSDPHDSDSEVLFLPSPTGRAEISIDLLEFKSNRRYRRGGSWFPDNVSFGLASADPFSQTKVEGKRYSQGTGAVYMYRVGDGKDIDQIEGDRLVCIYSARPTVEEYCEDMLMMAQFFGVMMFPEVNVPHVVLHFTKRGYIGYLKHGIDPLTRRMRATAGFHSKSGSQQDLWSKVRDYLLRSGHREMHAPFLKQCYDIKGIEDLTHNDIFVAVGGCFLGADDKVMEDIEQQTKDMADIGDWF